MINRQRLLVSLSTLAFIVVVGFTYLLLDGPIPHLLAPFAIPVLMIAVAADVVRFRLQLRREVVALAEFLFARYDEDEQWARVVAALPREARIFDDLEAKRRVVEFLKGKGVSVHDVLRSTGSPGQGEHAVRVMRILASPYADHRDFRTEWLETSRSRAVANRTFRASAR